MKYPKIHRLGKEEVEDILNGQLIIQEKIDGANTSIWRDGDLLCFGSRNHEVPNFRGIKEYVLKNIPIINLLDRKQNYRLFGEWLIKHTISYNQLSYGHFYLFDIFDDDKEEWLSPVEVNNIAGEFGIKAPYLYPIGEYTQEELNKLVGTSTLGDNGEGVVIKNHSFRNKFGDRCYAKIVTEKFKEENKINFGGNDKHSDCYWETYCMNKFITEARVKKIIQKLESQENRKVELKDTPRISNTCYHDMIEEEAWEMNKKNMKIDFTILSRMCQKKIVLTYKEILENEKK